MSTITVIASGDNVLDSRTVINDNFDSLLDNKIETSTLSTDNTFASASDLKIPSQLAVKTYVDVGGNVNASETAKGIVEEATNAEVTAGTATGATGAKLFVTPAKLTTRLSGTTNTQTFTTAGADTWEKPTLGTYAFIKLWGGGGSGAKEGVAPSSAGGGGGGGYAELLIPLSSLGTSETVTIGAGGAAVSSIVDGNAGVNSTFGSWLTAYGGGKGSKANGTTAGGGGGAGPMGAGGAGAVGAAGVAGSPGTPLSSAGGLTSAPTAAMYGGGGGGNNSGTPNAGSNAYYGGGGGGAADGSGGTSAGGTSVLGGAGGAGSTSGAATAGTQPAGGGGGSAGASGGNSGKGGDGKCIVYVF